MCELNVKSVNREDVVHVHNVPPTDGPEVTGTALSREHGAKIHL